ncbi:MAG: DoxX family protein [Acidobacteriia bacterium]|nr:DoxX family protein [Terriglobia bacterium]
MQSTNQTTRKSFWAGWIITVLVVLLLIFDGMTKVLQLPFVMEATAKSGFPLHLIAPIGATLLVCTAIYLIPRTSILGAILLTGYLGGAVLANLRDGFPFFSIVLLPVYFGILVWAGVYLRDSRLRALIPLRG